MRSAAKYIWLLVFVVFVGAFLLYDVSGLAGRQAITLGTTVAEVNGEPITNGAYMNAYTALINQQQEQSGETLNEDEVARLKDAAFERLVEDILLQQEIERRGITVTDEEIQQAALYAPPPEFMQNPDFQTEGRFDIEKYQRFMRSPMARQQGVLVGLEQYYRSTIPRQKLFDQVASTVYISDGQLWRAWQDSHDSAQVSFVSFGPETVPDSAVTVSDEEIRRYFEAHREEFADVPGRAIVSVVMIPRPITAADSAGVRDQIVALRGEIEGGAKFEDVARRESADSVSAADGGSLGWSQKGAFVEAFDNAAWALRPGQLSEPVLSPFGYHLIRVDERQGDSLLVRHVLLRIQPSDSTEARVSRQADELLRLTGQGTDPARLDSAAKRLGLQVGRAEATEGEPLTWDGVYVPGGSAWAFSGVRAGDINEQLEESASAYFLTRLDSVVPGGRATLQSVRDEIRRRLVRQKKIDALVPRAQRVASAIVNGQTLEQAARAEGLEVVRSSAFSRGSAVPGLGRLNEAVGAAFGLPVGAVSAPIKTESGVYVLRVERRVNADRAAWEAQKETQRADVLQQLQQQRVRQFLANLRKAAEIEDNRRAIEAAGRELAA
jgi:peptidyl-prolyl cis-trans isomerase D